METLYNGYTLQIAPGAFPLSTDSIALADFVRLPRNAKVLDLGSGCGTLGILLCAKDNGCTVTGIELDENAHLTALKNCAANQLHSRFYSICADLTAMNHVIRPGSFDVCVSNPPYFHGGFLHQKVPLARQDKACTLEDLLQGAAGALKFGGDLFLVHKPERLAELFSTACAYKLEPKRLCLLRHKESGPVSLVLVQCRKGAKPGLIWEDAILHHGDGTPTDYYRQIYHLQEK